MTTAARQLEADRVELVYYWALNALGNALIVDSLDLWSTVPATKAASRSSWLVELLKLMFGFRREAQELAIRYYRLVRALRTGFTIGIDGEAVGDSVSLESLRQDFEDIVDEIERETTGDVPPDIGDESDVAYLPEPDLESGDDNDDIEIDQTADLQDLMEQADRDADEQARAVLDNLGTKNLTRKLDKLDPDEAHKAAGNRQAAAAMRIMMNAARGLTYNLASTDLRIVGWVRYSRSGHPCGWCAMLITRGFTDRSGLYFTRKNAQHQGKNQEEDKFHDNCRCVAVPIFLTTQLDSDLFSLNREFAALWQDRISGQFTGDEALSEWRRLLRNRNNEAAQAAA